MQAMSWPVVRREFAMQWHSVPLVAAALLFASACTSTATPGNDDRLEDAGFLSLGDSSRGPTAVHMDSGKPSMGMPDGGSSMGMPDSSASETGPDTAADPDGVADASSGSSGDAMTEEAPSDASSDAVSAPPDTRLFPLEVGRSWTYQITSSYSSCPAGQGFFDVVGTTTVNGGTAFDVLSPCGYEGTYTETGDIVDDQYSTSNGTWFRDLDEPVMDGYSWTTTNGSATFSMTYSSAGTVTVPAGTFTDCWMVTQGVPYTQTWTYCQGVGQVSSVMVDLSGGGISYQLLSKNF
jgi:hypothetical protein